MPKGLNITNRASITLYDLAQTAGVEYEDKDNEYDNQEEEYKEENQDSDSDSNSSNNDGLAKWSRQLDSNSDSKSNLDNSDDDYNSTNMNEQVCILDSYVSTTEV